MMYLASPYRHQDRGIMHARYIAVARAYPRLVAGLRHDLYCPVVHGHALDVEGGKPMGDRYWLDHSLSMLRRCVGLVIYTLPGWQQSEGVRIELAEAGRLGFPVFYFGPRTDEYDELRVRGEAFIDAVGTGGCKATTGG